MIELLVVLIVAGVVLYLVGMIPMDPAFLQIIRVLVILFAVLYAADWVLHLTGHAGHSPHFR